MGDDVTGFAEGAEVIGALLGEVVGGTTGAFVGDEDTGDAVTGDAEGDEVTGAALGDEVTGALLGFAVGELLGSTIKLKVGHNDGLEEGAYELHGVSPSPK